MSDNPWAQEQAAFNQQATGQAGAGAGTSAPPGPAQQQDPATSYGAQPVPEHVITAESARQQESFPGFGLSSQGGWPSQGQDALYSSGGLAPMSQEQSERLLEWIVLRQIEDTPPIVRKGFMIVEQHTGVRRSQLAMGGQFFLAKSCLHQRREVESRLCLPGTLSFLFLPSSCCCRSSAALPLLHLGPNSEKPGC